MTWVILDQIMIFFFPAKLCCGNGLHTFEIKSIHAKYKMSLKHVLVFVPEIQF